MHYYTVLCCLTALLTCTTSYASSTPPPADPGAGDAHQAEDPEASSGDNSTYYSTREMRDMVLKEWGGKTKEIQEYFDQLPSEEFKENSEDLKLKYYFERKGVEDIESTEQFNITSQLRHPTGPEYTIEVNDSYVPKYRVTTSEEIRMEKYGTFNTLSESDSDSSEVVVGTTETPPDSSGQTPKGKKGKKGKKKWPPHMNPKERRKKKKKAKVNTAQTKRKEQLEARINNLHRVNLKGKNVKVINMHPDSPADGNGRTHLNTNKQDMAIAKAPNINGNRATEQAINKKLDHMILMHSNLGRKQEHSLINRRKQGNTKAISIFNKFMQTCTLTHHQYRCHHHPRHPPSSDVQAKPYL